MATIKSTIDGFLFPFIERYVDLIAKDGEETIINGIKVLDEESAFTHGALIHAATILYISYHVNGDKRENIALDRLKSFIDIILKRESVKTWGKLGILRGLYKLYKSGLLYNIELSRIDGLNILTDYSDFFDKEMIELKGYATNYYQVALACALYREALGFDPEQLSCSIESKFMAIAFPETGEFMDDELGCGRYDRYTLILSSEVSDLYRDVERPIPKIVSDNLKTCAEYSLEMANNAGDGVNYGRSLSVHGDLTPAEILSSALSRGLVSEEKIDSALSYIYSVLQKVLYFWYNSSMGSFDIWCNGRTTNNYRQIHRLLEVNMDMVSHLNTLYANIISSGLENTRIKAINNNSDSWTYKKLDFDSKHSLYIIHYKDYLVELPFIGTKVYGLTSSYNSFPSICGVVEGSPESELPFLVPEYKDNEGILYRPVHYAARVEEKLTDDGFVITAYGSMMRTDDRSKSEIEYKQECYFYPGGITVEFETDHPFVSATMYSATQNDLARIFVGGFDESFKLRILDNNDFKTPHGAYTKAYSHHSTNTSRLGYKIELDI